MSHRAIGRKHLFVALFLATGIVTALLTSLPSCDGPPDKTCFASRVNALTEPDAAGPSRACSVCLQSKNAPKACCDAVGACDEDPTKKCVPSFQAAHLCVVDGGRSAESRCKGMLEGERASALYACMRSNCGPECGVPSCDLDPAVVLFANPSCDRCMGGGCCEQINACYGDRRCKLTLECITKNCPRTLGPSMTELTDAGPDVIRRLRDAVCTPGSQPAPGDVGPGACLQRCLDDFAPGPEGGGTSDDFGARCLAFGVYACGAESNCGPSCARPDAGPYSGTGEWPEDGPAGPADAGAD